MTTKQFVLTKDHVRKFLATQKLMVIATCGDFPWAASVYYAFDNDLNLYFLSGPETLHARQILQNPKVAVAIADSHQKNSEKKRGLQISGLAEQIVGMKKVKYALELWKRNIRVTDPKLTFKVVTRSMFKVTPKRVKLFDQELFKVEDGNEPVLEL